MGYTNLVLFSDDGVSRVTMNSPVFNEMMAGAGQRPRLCAVRQGHELLGTRLHRGRRLMEEDFPEHNIRLVAISDAIDTDEGENEMAPIKNLFNEWYDRDISKKRRISSKIKGNAGEPMGQPPYRYMKDPDDPKHWIVDEEAAAVVRRVYSMTLDGYGTE